jgi:hypothetical protein
MLDRLSSDAGGDQLPAAHDSVLPCRERADRLIDGKRDGFGSHSNHKASRLVHGDDLRATNATEDPPSMPI